MVQNKVYRTIAEISGQISARLEAVDKGTCSLTEMDDLLSDLRELEERIIIIRYKGMERMQYPEPSDKALRSRAVKSAHAPELPLDTETIATGLEQEVEPSTPMAEEESPGFDTLSDQEVEEPEDWPNQISLIDSIEEISKEASINERMKTRSKRSLAQSLQSKKVESVLKALNLNEKMGLVKQVFNGDEVEFKAVMGRIDESSSKEDALAILATLVTDEQREKTPVIAKLDSLIVRRFS